MTAILALPHPERPTYTQFPNVYLDRWMGTISGEEWKCLSLIVRQTWGRHERSARAPISLLQFIRGTGLQRGAICRALAGLVEKGAITKHRRVLPNGGDSATAYALVMGDTSEPPEMLVADWGESQERTGGESCGETPPVPAGGVSPQDSHESKKELCKEKLASCEVSERASGDSTPEPTTAAPEQSDLERRLIANGVNPEQVGWLVATFGAERCERQLEWLPARPRRDNGGMLYASIVKNYEAPDGWLAAQDRGAKAEQRERQRGLSEGFRDVTKRAEAVRPKPEGETDPMAYRPAERVIPEEVPAQPELEVEEEFQRTKRLLASDPGVLAYQERRQRERVGRSEAERQAREEMRRREAARRAVAVGGVGR